MRRAGRLHNEALRKYLVRSGATQPAADAVENLLLGPFEDPHPDRRLCVDADHYLYGAPRRLRSGPRR